MTRREAREQAFIILFEKIFNSETPIFEIVESAKEADLIKINGFAENILKAVEANAEEIDISIQNNSPDWTISRLPKVSLAILRLAVAEIKYIDEVPNGVAVNEAVELAKKYGTNEDAAFINGILGTIVKTA
ncbi:MAG: transcription antitermination factor NusB [Acutalibacteraceae bacterium]